jgi:hypothetical protein
MKNHIDESGFVFPFEKIEVWHLSVTEIFKRRKLFKEKEASEIRNKAIVIYGKITALIKSLRRRT